MNLFIGLMSGTSIDGIDGVLADLDEQSLRPRRVLHHVHASFDAALARDLLALNTPGSDELHRAAIAGNRLMEAYASVVSQLLQDSGCPATTVAAVGAHGQTVRHRPRLDGSPGYTVQLANGALLAERCGIATVCDFRSADVAAGGQGAPLVPAFHAACFAQPGRDVALLNVGGIANLSLLRADGSVLGFDTGPGNVLMDLWSVRTSGSPYDVGGRLAASGQVHPGLLAALLAEPYFAQPAPKSTGRDLFHAAWLDAHVQAVGPIDAADVMATLAELTVQSVVDSLNAHLPGADSLKVCGGGAANAHLMQRWRTVLSTMEVGSTADVGVPPEQMEALAFAWLAACRLAGRPASLPAVTGAIGPRVLGALYPAPV